ncbi:MAG: CapA family protein [Ignavibacteriales bacterium]|nr:CapA family protein [Ignavibacteriales bacterium]
MKKLFLILTVAAVSFYFFSQLPRTKQKEIVRRKTISFSFVGDLMCHSPQFESARVSADSFDFRPTFKEVKELLSKADFTIGNLETVILGKKSRYSGYPMFNSPEEYLAALKDAGFDILVTSNNHSMDRGITVINRTIENVRKYGMMNYGTYNSAESREKILVAEKNGIRVALLAYTYGLNGNNLPKQKSYAVNLIDTMLIKNDIANARQQNTDAVIVYFHFGEEYERKANSYQKGIVQRTISYGADLIIASHPHVIQPIEFFESPKSKLDQGFVAYSLGNFVSNQRWRYSDCGVILNFTIEKNDTNKVLLDTLFVEPVWVSKERVSGRNAFVLHPSDTSVYKSFKRLNKSDQAKLVQSYYDTKQTMNAVALFKRKNSLRAN